MAAAGGRAEAVRRKLTAAGLSSEECDKYTALLRRFLSARLTKVRFQTELERLLPRSKIAVHNGIVRDLLARAQQRREGVPDLPQVVPVAERPGARRPNTVLAGAAAVSAAARADRAAAAAAGADGRPGGAASRKRPRPERDGEDGAGAGAAASGVGTSAATAVGVAAAAAAATVTAGGVAGNGVGGAGGAAGVGGPGGRNGRAPVGQRVPPGVGAAHGRVSGTAPPLQRHDVATYNMLLYFPLRPGLSLDMSLFMRLRTRMREHAVEAGGMTSVRDDAVSLATHAVELHVKAVMEAAVRARAARSALRPHGGVLCGPVRCHDLREAALRNSSFLGDEAGLDLERLSLLLF